MKQLRIALGVIFGFWLLLGIAGASYWITGERKARRLLPPEKRTAEAIHKLYDDAVCFHCVIGGSLLLGFSVLFASGVLLIWALVELVNLYSQARKRKGEEGARYGAA
ncbi:MAG TPA: hypothetical protein VEZ40_08650 [Pyrinomonadaceae bacterium]|nr:hypothetical protein [Pyrinomonadaceae bacterium]